MTTPEARTLCKAINRHVRKERIFEGGRAYGVDWPTWQACYPQLAATFNVAGHVLTQTMDKERRYLPSALFKSY